MNPYYQRNGITIYHAKWQDVLSSLPVIDSVITDSPYGIEVTKMTLGNGKKKIYRGKSKIEDPGADLIYHCYGRGAARVNISQP